MKFFQIITKSAKPLTLALRIWFFTSLVFGTAFMCYMIFKGDNFWAGIMAAIVAGVASLPVLLVLIIALPFIGELQRPQNDKIIRLVILCFVCTLPYGFLGGSVFATSYDNNHYLTDFITYALETAGALFACSVAAMLLTRNSIIAYFSFSQYESFSNSLTQIHLQMETEQKSYTMPEEKSNSNKTLIKGVITGVLILVMMIPTLFVSNLVTEREERQKDVVKEVTGKWASDQIIAGPYIFLPYTVNTVSDDNKVVVEHKHISLLPENLSVTGEITPEIRPRSIYKVLLYKSNLKGSGNFSIHLPKEIDPASLQLADAKICFGITDFKGIEEKIAINFNGANYELSPGLPSNDIDTNGLSAPVNLSATDFGKDLQFNMQLKIKGSDQLHFVPLSGNSSVELKSSWANPAFDGNNLPGERTVTENGFTAKWKINKANLPFGTVLPGTTFNKNSFAFGVSMLQPADQYAKTMRSVKYAILFIGLTFSLFFIVEVMQKKPLHPVQYVLVGLALVIFYTLLLSFSEFILFDQAYLVASFATIMLITLYAKSHFQNWKTAVLFGAVLSGLYGFIFILIRLEDTALLIGSIGLFLVLALVMYGSRKVNWYNTTATESEIASA